MTWLLTRVITMSRVGTGLSHCAPLLRLGSEQLQMDAKTSEYSEDALPVYTPMTWYIRLQVLYPLSALLITLAPLYTGHGRRSKL